MKDGITYTRHWELGLRVPFNLASAGIWRLRRTSSMNDFNALDLFLFVLLLEESTVSHRLPKRSKAVSAVIPKTPRKTAITLKSSQKCQYDDINSYPDAPTPVMWAKYSHGRTVLLRLYERRFMSSLRIMS